MNIINRLICRVMGHRRRKLVGWTKGMPEQDQLMECPRCGEMFSRWTRRKVKSQPAPNVPASLRK